MRRLSAGNFVLKALGLLLVTAAALKGHELLTVPVARQDFWSGRPFLIGQVECELALGLWLLSGLCEGWAWLASLLCFGLFCGVTLYKGLTGATTCGCFGAIHVHPWVTLLAIDLPAVVALGLVYPHSAVVRFVSCLRRQNSRRQTLGRLVGPALSLRSTLTAGGIGAALSVTSPLLIFHEPATATATYEVLEPETWTGRKLPILSYIDIADQLQQGTWLVLFYHPGCPDCQNAIRKYQKLLGDLADNQDLLRLAFIQVPPDGAGLPDTAPLGVLGHMAPSKEWFVATPVTALLEDARVRKVWDAHALAADDFIDQVVDCRLALLQSERVF
jgi:hypothetical protein